MFNLDILNPFDTSIWIILVLIIIFITIAINFTFHYEKINLSILSSLILCLGIFSSQGIYLKISSISNRVLIISLFITGFMIRNFYTCGLVSFLVESKYESNIKTKDDLAESDLNIGFVDSIVIRHYISVNQNTN